MNKKELIRATAEKAGVTQKLVGEILEATLETITDTLVAGDEVAITGFGKFSVTERVARKGINPSTMEEIEIEASKTAKFKAGSTLKETLNA